MTVLMPADLAASIASSAAAGAAQRIHADRQELVRSITHALPQDGSRELQPGLFCYRRSRPTQASHVLYDPALCVIAQGSKMLIWGGETLRYDPANYLITTVGLPMTGQIVKATPAQPYLSMRLRLMPAVVASVMVDAGFSRRNGNSSVGAANVSALDAELLNAALRLVRLAEFPADYSALAPLVIREIIYRLLSGMQAHRMMHLAQVGGHAQRIVRAVEMLREGYARSLRLDQIAKSVNMSVSAFHRHFKLVTAMSPLQFQKQLRLQEARRLMINENLNAGEAGYRVGYEDASQFNREYKRHFGRPPVRDVESMQGFPDPAPADLTSP